MTFGSLLHNKESTRFFFFSPALLLTNPKKMLYFMNEGVRARGLSRSAGLQFSKKTVRVLGSRPFFFLFCPGQKAYLAVRTPSPFFSHHSCQSARSATRQDAGSETDLEPYGAELQLQERPFQAGAIPTDLSESRFILMKLDFRLE